MKRLPLLVLLVLLLPAASAASAQVRLEEADGAWNGHSEADAAPNATVVDVWVPAHARLHRVDALGPDGARAASYRALGADALRVALPEGALAARAEFDFTGNPALLARFVAPSAYDAVDFELAPPEGFAVEADGVTFEPAAGVWRARLVDVPEGESLRLRVVEEGRVGELPILASLALVSGLVLAGAWAYHKARPPLEGRAPERFLDHLRELQARLVPPVLVFGLLNVLFFTFGLREIDWSGMTLVVPTFGAEGGLATRAFAAFAETMVPDGVQLVAIRPADAILAQVQMTIFLAFLAVLPLILYEVAAFVGPALLPRERVLALRTVPLVSALFLAGCVFAYLVMAPLMIRTLYAFAPGVGALPLLAVGDLVSFALLVVLAFGLAFELPVVMFALSRVGLVKAATFRRYFRHAVVVIVIAAGLLTPDPSVVSQLLVALPVTMLYVLGMASAEWAQRQRDRAVGAA